PAIRAGHRNGEPRPGVVAPAPVDVRDRRKADADAPLPIRIGDIGDQRRVDAVEAIERDRLVAVTVEDLHRSTRDPGALDLEGRAVPMLQIEAVAGDSDVVVAIEDWSEFAELEPRAHADRRVTIGDPDTAQEAARALAVGGLGIGARLGRGPRHEPIDALVAPVKRAGQECAAALAAGQLARDSGIAGLGGR